MRIFQQWEAASICRYSSHYEPGTDIHTIDIERHKFPSPQKERNSRSPFSRFSRTIHSEQHFAFCCTHIPSFASEHYRACCFSIDVSIFKELGTISSSDCSQGCTLDGGSSINKSPQ